MKPRYRKTLHDVTLYESRPNQDMVCLAINREGDFEPESIAIWKAAIITGQVALDIGAYSGIYAMIAVRCGAKQAQAWEANPDVVSLLRRNVDLNRMAGKVLVCPWAAGSSNRSGFLSRRFAFTSAGQVRRKPAKDAMPVDVKVPNSADPVCAVKIDVEGAEVDVLDGLASIIDRDRPVVIAEALNQKQERALYAWFKGRHYSCRDADSRNLVFLPCKLQRS